MPVFLNVAFAFVLVVGPIAANALGVGRGSRDATTTSATTDSPKTPRESCTSEEMAAHSADIDATLVPVDSTSARVQAQSRASIAHSLLENCLARR